MYMYLKIKYKLIDTFSEKRLQTRGFNRYITKIKNLRHEKIYIMNDLT